MMSKIYAYSRARSNSDSSRGIVGRGIAMQETGRDLSNTIATTATNSATIRTTAPTLRQSISRISDADNGSTSSEANISRISLSRGGSGSRGEGGKCGAHTTRPPPTVTPIAAPGQQTGLMVTPILPKSVFRVFMGSAARGIFLREKTLTSPASHSRRERFSLQSSPPKPDRVEEKTGFRSFGPAPTVVTEGLRTRPWPFTLRAEPAISFGGPVAKEKSSPCYTPKMANDGEPVEKAIIWLLCRTPL